MDRGIGPRGPCRSYTYIGRSRRPPHPGFSVSNTIIGVSNTVTNSVSPSTSVTPVSTSIASSRTKEGCLVADDKVDDRNKDDGSDSNIENSSSDTILDKMMEQDVEDTTQNDLANENAAPKPRDINPPIRAQDDPRYPHLTKRESVILEEEEEGLEEDDSGGDSSSWMTQYIAHNAPLGNEKKGEGFILNV